jgi:hypothetical protein
MVATMDAVFFKKSIVPHFNKIKSNQNTLDGKSQDS